jgi:hypothetical protein
MGENSPNLVTLMRNESKTVVKICRTCFSMLGPILRLLNLQLQRQRFFKGKENILALAAWST